MADTGFRSFDATVDKPIICLNRSSRHTDGRNKGPRNLGAVHPHIPGIHRRKTQVVHAPRPVEVANAASQGPAENSTVHMMQVTLSC